MQTEAFKPTQNEDGTLSVQDIVIAASSASAELTAKGPNLRIANVGAGNVYYAFSNQAGTTITTGVYIPAGAVEVITRPEKSRYIITLGSAIGALNIVGGTGKA